MRVLLLSVTVATAACGELRGASEYSDAYFQPSDAAARDSSRTDASSINALDGFYQSQPIPETRAAFRLDSSKTPDQPWLVFVSTATRGEIACDVFKSVDWNRNIPTSAVIHAIQLGARAAGTYVINNALPLGPERAFVGRTTQTESPLSYEKALSGTVSVTRFDIRGAAGNLSVLFETYIDDQPEPEPVRGDFDVITCAVDW